MIAADPLSAHVLRDVSLILRDGRLRLGGRPRLLPELIVVEAEEWALIGVLDELFLVIDDAVRNVGLLVAKVIDGGMHVTRVHLAGERLRYELASDFAVEVLTDLGRGLRVAWLSKLID